jgi:hypothetical protein
MPFVGGMGWRGPYADCSMGQKTEEQRFDSQQRKKFFLFCKVSGLVLGSIQPII